MHSIIRVNHIANSLKHIPPLVSLIDFDSLSYEDCVHSFFSLRLVYGNSISRSLQKLGFEINDLVFDCFELQLKWLKQFYPEHVVTEKNWQIEILSKQIIHYKPEVLFFQNDLRPFGFQDWHRLKDLFPQVKKIIVHRGVDGKYQLLKGADLVLLGSPKMVDDFSDNGVNCDLMYHYFDEEILFSESDPKDHNLTFVGSSGCGSRQHTNRYWLLYYMLLNTDIRLYIDESIPNHRGCEETINLLFESIASLQSRFVSQKEIRSQLQKVAIANHLQSVKENTNSRDLRVPAYKLLDAFPGRCHNPVYGLEYYKILSTSTISFDIHSDFAKGYSVALRLFHATGCKSCLLVDKGKNLHSIFDIDKEVVAYSSPEEAKEKAQYLLDNPSIAKQIAYAGYKRTLKDHSSIVRANELAAHISSLFRQ